MLRGSLALSFSLLLGCSSNNFVDTDGGDGGGNSDGGDGSIGVIEGGGNNDGGDAAPPPPPVRRLFVANNGAVSNDGLLVWDDADKLAGDRAPDVVVAAINTPLTAMALVKDRLFVASTPPANRLYGFDGAGMLGAAAVPAFTITPGAISDIHWSSKDDLLFLGDRTTNNGAGVRMFANAQQMKSTDTAKATFGGNGLPTTGLYHDPVKDRIYMAVPQQVVIKYSESASTTTGASVSIADFASIPAVNAWTSDGTRLYAGGTTLQGETAIFIYNIAGLHPGSAPDVVIKNGLPAAGGNVFGMYVAENMLFVGFASGSTQATLLFTNALSLSPQSTGTALPLSGACTGMRYSTKTDRLYCADYVGSAVNVWSNVKTTPVRAAQLKTKVANPFAVELWEN